MYHRQSRLLSLSYKKIEWFIMIWQILRQVGWGLRPRRKKMTYIVHDAILLKVLHEGLSTFARSSTPSRNSLCKHNKYAPSVDKHWCLHLLINLNVVKHFSWFQFWCTWSPSLEITTPLSLAKCAKWLAIKDQVAKILSGYYQEIFKPTRPLKVKVRILREYFQAH